MSSHGNENNASEVRMELKYCEHCGGLWVRECGAGVVYCRKCQAEVEEMPSRKKAPGRVRLRLPQMQPSVAERYGLLLEDEAPDLDAAGGVA